MVEKKLRIELHQARRHLRISPSRYADLHRATNRTQVQVDGKHGKTKDKQQLGPNQTNRSSHWSTQEVSGKPVLRMVSSGGELWGWKGAS
jgi:hypothetical protein